VVRGGGGRGPVALTANEYRTAERLREDYWLYVAFDCASVPRLLTVQDPARLGWEPIVVVEHYRSSRDAIEEAATDE
jgi:nanoRNase/pAp phosphatase (c-di-AMP/oligoRNAs hydrolase)